MCQVKQVSALNGLTCSLNVKAMGNPLDYIGAFLAVRFEIFIGGAFVVRPMRTNIPKTVY